MNIQNVKGTHDVILKEAQAYERIESVMKAIAESYCFKEFRVPVIENSALFLRSVGESSDIVRKEMYTFLDKGGRSLTLRPEFTAGIIRSFVNNKLYATKDLPVKAYYVGPVFRYERPQLGRYRQFNQFGIETIGTTSVYHDVEAILLGYTILTALGLENVKVKINTLGDALSRQNYKNALKEYFSNHIDDMCVDCKQRYELNPLRILDCKVKEDQDIVKNAPTMSNYLSDDAKKRFDDLCALLEQVGVDYEIDDTLVRGLDYYSQTVFEYHYTSKKGINYGAVGAGGHYDGLVKEMDGPQLEGVGLSFGVERVFSVLNDDELLADVDDGCDVFVMPMGEDANEIGFYLLTTLRQYGFTSEIDVSGSKLSSMLKKANRLSSKYAIILGEEEINTRILTIKDLFKQEQYKINVDNLIDFLDSRLNNAEDEHEHCSCNDEKEHHCCGHHDETQCCGHESQKHNHGCCGHNHDEEHHCCNKDSNKGE